MLLDTKKHWSNTIKLNCISVCNFFSQYFSLQGLTHPKHGFLSASDAKNSRTFLYLLHAQPKTMVVLICRGARLQDPPSPCPRPSGVLQTSSDRDDQRIFSSGIFLGNSKQSEESWSVPAYYGRLVLLTVFIFRVILMLSGNL